MGEVFLILIWVGGYILGLRELKKNQDISIGGACATIVWPLFLGMYLSSLARKYMEDNEEQKNDSK